MFLPLRSTVARILVRLDGWFGILAKWGKVD